MSTIPNREIKNLTSRDLSKRRKAIRMLFESDDENNLQYFSKLITDNDPWFRSKAYEAYKMWAPRIGTKAIIPLVESKSIEANRQAASTLFLFDKDEASVAKKLIDKEDNLCQIKAAEFLLNQLNNTDFFNLAKIHQNPSLRKIALNSDYAKPEDYLDGLGDNSVKVINLCLEKLNTNANYLEDEDIKNLHRNGASIPLLIEHSFHNGGSYFLELCHNLNSEYRSKLVSLLNNNCQDLENARIKLLIQNNFHDIIGRWLQGKKSKKMDQLRWKIIEDENVDEITRAKMLERLFSRSDEYEIKEKADLLIKNTKSELIITAAQNLSTTNSRES